MRRLGAALAAAAVGLALTIAPTASSSGSLRVGIFDDGVVLYGEPDLVFPQLAKTGTQLVRVNLWWAGPGIRVATRRPTRPADPNDPAYNWDTYDRTVRFAIVNGIQPVFSIIGTPPWANAARGLERRALRTRATFACSRTPRSGATAARSSTRTASRFRA